MNADPSDSAWDQPDPVIMRDHPILGRLLHDNADVGSDGDRLGVGDAVEAQLDVGAEVEIGRRARGITR